MNTNGDKKMTPNACDWPDAPKDLREAWASVCPKCNWWLSTKTPLSFTDGFKCYKCGEEIPLHEWNRISLLNVFVHQTAWEREVKAAISKLYEEFGI